MTESKNPFIGEDLLTDEDIARARLPLSQSPVSVPFSVSRRRISDNVFRTTETIRTKVGYLSVQSGNEFLNGNLEVQVQLDEADTLESGQHDTTVRIPVTAAVTLASSARIAEGWKVAKSDLPRAIQETVHPMVEQIRRAGTVNELVRMNPDWEGVIRALVTDAMDSGDSVYQLAHGLNERVLESDGSFNVDALPFSTTNERMHAVAAGIVKRIHELCGVERQKILEQMRGWREWLDKMRSADVPDIDAMTKVYEKVQIRQDLLGDLVSRMPAVKKTALNMVQSKGGFLNDPNTEDLQQMIEKGQTSVLVDNRNGNVIGYYGVLTDTPTVLEHLSKYYGYDPKEKYTAGNLPSKGRTRSNGSERPVFWTNRDLAVDMFQNAKHLAVSVEVAVDETAAGRRGGGATALKLDVYNKVLQKGKSYVLLRHFEILKVNGEPVPAAVNRASRIFIEVLGGHEIGYYPDRIVREDGTVLEVNWHVSISDVEESVRVIGAPKRK